MRVALLWCDTVLSEQVFAPHATITIGADPKADVPLPASLGIGRHVLLEPVGDDYGLNVTPTMRGAVTCQLEPGDCGLVHIGDVGLFFEFDHPERIARRTPWALLEPGPIASLTAAVALHFAVLIGAFVLWDQDPALAALALDDRAVFLTMQELLPPPEPEPEPVAVDDPGESDGIEGPEGAVGEPEKKRPTRLKPREGDRVKRLLQRMDSDVLERLVTGRDKFREDLKVGIAGLDTVDEIGHGFNALGLRGTGKGGPGEGFGKIRGFGTGPGISGTGGTPKGRLAGRKKKKRPPLPPERKPEVSGGFCAHADIARVVRRHRNGISHCYELRLASRPELAGKVTLRWLIGLDGRVVSVLLHEDLLGSREVVGCMKRAVRRWRFKKPEKGQCMVKYPFVFNPG